MENKELYFIEKNDGFLKIAEKLQELGLEAWMQFLIAGAPTANQMKKLNEALI